MLTMSSFPISSYPAIALAMTPSCIQAYLSTARAGTRLDFNNRGTWIPLCFHRTDVLCRGLRRYDDYVTSKYIWLLRGSLIELDTAPSSKSSSRISLYHVIYKEDALLFPLYFTDVSGTYGLKFSEECHLLIRQLNSVFIVRQCSMVQHTIVEATGLCIKAIKLL